jgi:hypothetical protein
VVTVPAHALVLRRRPSDLGLVPARAGAGAGRDDRLDAPRAFGRSAVLRSASFRWLAVAFWLLTFATMAVAVHMIPLLLDQGLELGTAVAAAAIVGGMQLPGRILLGPLERRVPPRAVALSVFLLQTLGLVALAAAKGPPGVLAFAVLFGAGAGASTLVRATVVARLYGVESYGSISGVLALFVTSARALAPLAVSLAYGLAGDYTAVLWTLVAMSIAACGALHFVERPR